MTVYLHTFLQLLWAFFQCSAEAADPGIFGDRGDEVDSVMAVDVDGSFVGGAQTRARTAQVWRILPVMHSCSDTIHITQFSVSSGGLSSSIRGLLQRLLTLNCR